MANSCKDCKHDKGKCVGVSRAGSHRYCFEQKETTNADRIRAMSDEELAKAIASKAYTGACNDFDIPYDGKCCHNCEKCDAIIKWLKQPVE